MEILTKRQKETLKIISQSVEKNGYPPTLSELRDRLGVSSNQAVLDHLSTLEKKGFIKRENTARGIKILKNSEGILGKVKVPQFIPLLGHTTAGMPIQSEQYLEDWVRVSPEVSKLKEDVFLVKVHGDSMIGANISNGDMAMISPQKMAENGDIILAYLNGETTIKRIVKKFGKIYLMPENPNFEPILVDSDFEVQGKVVGVIRSL